MFWRESCAIASDGAPTESSRVPPPRCTCSNVALLRLLVGVPVGGSFTVPTDYDYSKSTNENYAVVGADGTGGAGGAGGGEGGFHGRYASIRASRDYKYHVHYSQARQEWQDSVVDSVVMRTSPQANPWIV